MKPNATPTRTKKRWLPPKTWKMHAGAAEGVYGSHGSDGYYSIS